MNPTVLFPLLLVLLETIVFLSTDMYLPALPNLRADLHTSQSLAQLTMTLWFWGAALPQLVVGPLSDRFGRRPLLLAGSVIFAVATWLCATVSSMPILLAARLLQGLCVGIVIVPGYAAIHELFEHVAAIRTIAWMNSISVLAPAAGPFLGGLMLLVGTWRSIFALLAILATVLTFLIYKVMPETLPPDKKRPLYLPQLAKNYCQIMLNRRFAGYCLVNGVAFFAMIAWITASPFLMITQFQFTPFQYGLTQGFIFLCFIAGTRVVHQSMSRFSAQQVSWAGLCVLGISSLFMMAHVAFIPEHMMTFASLMGLFSFGCSLIFSPLQRLAMESCPDAPMGARMAVYSFYFSIAGGCGSALINSVYDNTLSMLAFLLSTCGLLAVVLSAIQQKWLLQSTRSEG